jgi:hypothetical protein
MIENIQNDALNVKQILFFGSMPETGLFCF